MKIQDINPFVRGVITQTIMVSDKKMKKAYDNRLLFVLGGNGKIVFEDESYDLLPNTIVFIPVNVAYYFLGKVSSFFINFDMTQASNDIKRAKTPRTLDKFHEEDIFDKTLVDGLEKQYVVSNTEYYEFFLTLVTEYKVKNILFEEAASAIIKNILVNIYRNAKSNCETVSNNKLLLQTISYIANNYTHPITIAEIASALHYHPYYLSRNFKKYMHKTIFNYIMDERIKNAKQLLVDTSLSIENVAYECGFKSAAHFCVKFTKTIGIPPSEYRKQKSTV